MKKTYLILILSAGLAFVSTKVSAQSIDGGITVSNIVMTCAGGEIVLDMTVDVKGKAVAKVQSMAVAPQLTDGNNKISFPYVLVNGKNKAQIFERHTKFSYDEIMENTPFSVTDLVEKTFPDEQILYSAKLEKRDWMADARLDLQFILLSPAGERQVYTTAVTGTSVVEFQPQPVVVVEEPAPVVIVQEPATTPPVFTRPAQPVVEQPRQPVVIVRESAPAPVVIEQRPSYQQPAVVYGSQHAVSGSAYLDFEPGSSTLKIYYKRNPQELAVIERAMASVLGSPNARVLSLEITGYASPEGRLWTNEALAYERAYELAEYLKATYGTPVDYSVVKSVAEDWDGLRKLVAESNIPYKWSVIELIDSPESPDAKEAKLRRMMGGQIWNILSRDIFPQLRRVEYRIAYDIGQ